MRGYGIPQLAFAMESQMDDIAPFPWLGSIDFRMHNAMTDDFIDPLINLWLNQTVLVPVCESTGNVRLGRETPRLYRVQSYFKGHQKVSEWHCSPTRPRHPAN